MWEMYINGELFPNAISHEDLMFSLNMGWTQEMEWFLADAAEPERWVIFVRIA